MRFNIEKQKQLVCVLKLKYLSAVSQVAVTGKDEVDATPFGTEWGPSFLFSVSIPHPHLLLPMACLASIAI